jgi:hypothetical protein
MKLETAREKQIDAYIATNDVKEDEKMRVVLMGQPKLLEECTLFPHSRCSSKIFIQRVRFS